LLSVEYSNQNPIVKRRLVSSDLSLIHQPISDLLSSETAQQSDYRLTDEQVEFFHQNGYVSKIRILSESQIEQLLVELSDLFDPQHDGREWWHEYHTNESADPNTVLFHSLGAWRIKAGFHDVLWHPAFTTAAAQLLGGPVRFWHDQLFCKPAKHGGVVAWHQDYSYWTRTEPMSHLTCWIGLDESTRENGCLQYVPGSHRWSLLPITGLAGDMHSIREVLDDEQWEMLNNPVSIELLPGEAVFHHPLMVHGSKENRTNQPRRATVINAFRDGVKSATDTCLLDGIPVFEIGEKLEGQFFPLLTD
jgi:ectoine hydroxylase-related dioxygenase (phytanoyl-CoA dioxygenase family)